MRTFDEYRKLKRRFSIRYRGIDLSQVLALDLWQWANGDNRMQYDVSEINKSVDFSFFKDEKKHKIIYFDTERKDHEATFNSICDMLPSGYSIINRAYKKGEYVGCYSWKNRQISKVIVLWSLRDLQYTKEEIQHISYRICFILNSIDNLYKNGKYLTNITDFVAYSAIHDWANLIGQYFRHKGTMLWGLSHASHHIFNKNIPIDCLNYENLDVDYSVVWGKYTKEEYLKYGIKAKDIFVAGYPKQIQTKPIKKDNQFKKCLVLLANYAYNSSNYHLLELLNSVDRDCDFYVKCHPSNDVKSYERYIGNKIKILDSRVQLAECMDEDFYDFAIAVNTTCYYEIMIAGIPCLRYDDDGVFELTRGIEEDSFSNLEQFNECVKWLRKEISAENYGDTVNELLKYVLGIGINNYQKILP